MPWWMMRLLPAFAPETGGGGDEAPPAGGDKAPPAAAPDGAKPAADATPKAPARPDWLPEKFWDTEAGAPRVEALSQSYRDLERRHSMRADDLKKVLREEVRAEIEAAAKGDAEAGDAEAGDAARPETPAQYALPDVSDIMPDGMSFVTDDSDPLLGWFRQFAHERGLSQMDFQAAVRSFAQQQAMMHVDPAAEVAKLGERGSERIERVNQWLAANVSERSYNAMKTATTEAGFVEALEEVMQLAGEPSFEHAAPAVPAGASSREEYEAETRAMMKDPRYIDPRQRDPNFVQQVRMRWRKLDR